MKKRHSVLLLLSSLAVITFLDRIAISVAGPRIQNDLHITPDRWGLVIGAFVLAYGIFEIPTGALGDRQGQRRVLTRIVLWWSAFTALTGAATTLSFLLATRFLFGVGEAGAYPNISGVIARWFPITERARTQGFVWAASRLGGALSPLIVVPLQAFLGWRAAFLILGLIGCGWVICWRIRFRDTPSEQPGITAFELAEIGAGRPAVSGHSAIPWAPLLKSRQLWLIFTMYWCYAWGSWFFFGWFPVYLTQSAGFSEDEMGLVSALPFALGAAGNVAGGFLSDKLVKRFGVKTGRRAMGCASLAVSAAMLVAVTRAESKAAIIVLSALGFGVADLMLPSAWAVCLDTGRNYAGAVTGFMNTAGQFGGFVCSVLFGFVVQATGSYNLPLALVAAMVLLSAALFSRIDASRPIVPDKGGSHASTQVA